MIEDTAMELKHALVTLLATAASMGIEIDVLCEEASTALASDDQMNWNHW